MNVKRILENLKKRNLQRSHKKMIKKFSPGRKNRTLKTEEKINMMMTDSLETIKKLTEEAEKTRGLVQTSHRIQRTSEDDQS